MMLLSILALAQATPTVPAPPVLGALPKQALPQRGCAAYLWAVQDQRFVAMVEPGRLRIMLDGKPTDLTAAEAGGGATLGLASTTRYAGAGVTATLDMTITQRETLQDGAIVSDASIRLTRGNQDEIIVPVGGLVGCAPAER
ncbi:hypothetical protein V3I01_02645 [Sphingomonas sp. gentR]|uniref:Uncharacterized protein n=1 Tax=Sphingomonas yabuuchiae TaxID=172044 RepID=A0AA41A3Y8_9SPHN|nr:MULTISPECIES: hypothetical protein [Sphingomonas]APX65414.1 hypothetical protein AV944_05650 [Sphingomonas sp. LK11]MBB4608342.1 hypothetical protein [Sphingomonas yabuuchiae]MBN3560010.1 hypothetical protein [Sphingomonas yabuuchiae]